MYRYQDGGRLSDQLMTLLQYQQENIHFLNEEVCVDKENSDTLSLEGSRHVSLQEESKERTGMSSFSLTSWCIK